MVLNWIWIGFFLTAFIVGLGRMLFLNDMTVIPAIMGSSFTMAKTGFEISLGLTGVITLWLGFMKIGEKAGAVDILARIMSPLFTKLFPDLPPNHPALGSMMMNFSANMLGLDNAATPMGLKAMKEMQELNTRKDTATNPQIMFLVLNTSGLTLIPVSIMVYRAQLGAADPADIFMPILIATYFATLAGLISVALYQKINLLDKTILTYLGAMTAIITGIILFVSSLPQEKISQVSNLAGNFVLFSVIIGFIILAIIKKINVYESFIEGAKEGFPTAVTIIPYLIAILVAVGAFRASGAMDIIINGITSILTGIGMNADFIPALPTALMKPLSGSGARGLMVDAMKTYGADSFAGRLASICQGATDTTFYIIAVYFGSIGVKKTRYSVLCGLIADGTGIVAAILTGYLFFR